MFRKVGCTPAIVLAFSVMLIFLADLSTSRAKDAVVFSASRLPSQTGSLSDSHRLARPGVDLPGFINFGPCFPLRKGSYALALSYKSAAAASETIGWVDVFKATLNK